MNIQDDIQKLENIEDKLMLQLNTVPDENKDEIMKNIKNISDMKFRLYENIKNNYTVYNQQLSNTNKVLNEQEQAMGIINKEINEMNMNKQKIKNEILKKNKQVQINEYYGLYYQSHAYIFKIIIIGCFCVIFILLLKKNGILPNKIAWGVIIAIVVVVIVMIIKKGWNLYWRDDVNFNEYDWYFAKPST